MNMKSYEKIVRIGKLKEYEMKITKMAGHLADYYIDRAIESDDFSNISSFLIDYFSGFRKIFDVGYLISKYKEFGLNEKIEDIDFNIEEWYKVQFETEDKEANVESKDPYSDDYLQYMIEKRKKESDESLKKENNE